MRLSWHLDGLHFAMNTAIPILGKTAQLKMSTRASVVGEVVRHHWARIAFPFSLLEFVKGGCWRWSRQPNCRTRMREVFRARLYPRAGRRDNPGQIHSQTVHGK
jgi:hypothetical protein